MDDRQIMGSGASSTSKTIEAGTRLPKKMWVRQNLSEFALIPILKLHPTESLPESQFTTEAEPETLTLTDANYV